MSKPLGLMLVREKIISRTQLDQAQDLAEKSKLGLVQALLDQRAIDDGVLAVFVSEKMKIPLAEKAHLENIPGNIIRILPKDLADEFNAVPIGMEKSALKVAMLDPTDVFTVEEIQFFLGKRILPHIASQRNLFEGLRKHFQLPRKDLPVSPAATAAVANPIVLKEPEQAVVIPPPQAAPPQAPAPATTPPVMEASASEESLDALMQKLGGTVLPPTPGQASPQKSEPDIATPVHIPQGRPLAAVPKPSAINFDDFHKQTLARMDAAKDKDEIAEIFLTFAQSILQRVAVFAIKKNVLLGWLGKGEGFDEKSIKGIMIPLNSPSLFQRVKDTKVYYFGEVPPSTVNQIFLTAIGGVRPPNVILIPLAIKDKVFAIFYGDQGQASIPTTHLHYLHLLVPKVESSFGSLIVHMKTKR